jgi:hypothetical protein
MLGSRCYDTIAHGAGKKGTCIYREVRKRSIVRVWVVVARDVVLFCGLVSMVAVLRPLLVNAFFLCTYEASQFSLWINRNFKISKFELVKIYTLQRPPVDTLSLMVLLNQCCARKSTIPKFAFRFATTMTLRGGVFHSLFAEDSFEIFDHSSARETEN